MVGVAMINSTLHFLTFSVILEPDRYMKVAVIYDASSEAMVTQFMDRATGPEEWIPFQVACGPSLTRAIRTISTSGFSYAMNLCSEGHSDDEARSVLVALLLEQNHIPYTGCRSTTLAYPYDIVMMMLWYAELPLPHFAVVMDNDGIDAALTTMKPVKAVSTSPWWPRLESSLNSSSMTDVSAALKSGLKSHGALVVTEPSSQVGHPVAMVDVMIMSASKRPRVCIDAPAALRDDPSWPSVEGKLTAHAESFFSLVLYEVGYAKLRFTVVLSPQEIRLDAVFFNPPILELLAAFPDCLQELLQEALHQCPPPTYSIELHSDSRKGYRLCAAQNLSKGSIVFEDEGRSFAIVTRPHVCANWDAKSKVTFSEYAWPLDGEGHTYAIWEKEPSRWRPINHSCDPNCVFAAPHSLNIIAARDINKGDDLTMDYATFCDGTMKPFDCLCGSRLCRGRIQADERALQKYGKHSWFRAVPPPVAPIT